MTHELETEISNLLDLKDDNGSSVVELRDHLMEVYSKLCIPLLKKQQVYEEALLRQD